MQNVLAETVLLQDTARLLKRALVKLHPHVFFGVQSVEYLGGVALEVVWMDGPAYPLVNDIAQGFVGSSYDPMLDVKIRHHSWLAACGLAMKASSEGPPPCRSSRLVAFPVDYVHSRRIVSDVAVRSFKARWRVLSENARAIVLHDTEAWRIAAEQPLIWRYDEELTIFGREAEKVFLAMVNHCSFSPAGAVEACLAA